MRGCTEPCVQLCVALHTVWPCVELCMQLCIVLDAAGPVYSSVYSSGMLSWLLLHTVPPRLSTLVKSFTTTTNNLFVQPCAKDSRPLDCDKLSKAETTCFVSARNFQCSRRVPWMTYYPWLVNLYQFMIVLYWGTCPPPKKATCFWLWGMQIWNCIHQLQPGFPGIKDIKEALE